MNLQLIPKPEEPAQKPGLDRAYLRLASQIQALVVQGEFAVGQRLPAERALAERFDVSRTSLREAIIALELQGVVEVRGGSGIYVCEPKPGVARLPMAQEPGAGPFELLRALPDRIRDRRAGRHHPQGRGPGPHVRGPEHHARADDGQGRQRRGRPALPPVHRAVHRQQRAASHGGIHVGPGARPRLGKDRAALPHAGIAPGLAGRPSTHLRRAGGGRWRRGPAGHARPSGARDR